MDKISVQTLISNNNSVSLDESSDDKNINSFKISFCSENRTANQLTLLNLSRLNISDMQELKTFILAPEKPHQAKSIVKSNDIYCLPDISKNSQQCIKEVYNSDNGENTHNFYMEKKIQSNKRIKNYNITKNNEPFCCSKQKNKFQTSEQIAKKLTHLAEQDKYFQCERLNKNFIRRNLKFIIINKFSSDTDLNCQPNVRILHLTIPMDKTVLQNNNNIWFQLYGNLLEKNKIYKIENDFYKQRYRCFVESMESDSESQCISTSQLNTDLLYNWIVQLQYDVAEQLKESFSNHIKFVLKMQKDHSDEEDINTPEQSWLSGSIAGFSSRAVLSKKFNNISYTQIGEKLKLTLEKSQDYVSESISCDKIHFEKLSKDIKRFLRDKAYFRKEVIYDLETGLIKTSRIDVSHRLCSITDTKPTQKGNLGGVEHFKTRKFYKAIAQFFQKIDMQLVKQFKDVSRPFCVFDKDTKLFDKNGDIINGDIVLYKESFRKNTLFTIRYYTVLYEIL